jgi:AraC-like DNA-binding protein
MAASLRCHSAITGSVVISTGTRSSAGRRAWCAFAGSLPASGSFPPGCGSSISGAKQLAVSPRTLARRLSEEGTSFSDVLEGLRNDLAARYLADEDFGIAQIAWLLGYEETSAFSRAFKRWTGKTPRDARVPRKPLRKGARGAASSAPP